MIVTESSPGAEVMDQPLLSRRRLLAAALAVGTANLGEATLATTTAVTSAKGNSLFLRNVLLETGYDRNDTDVIGTRTAKASILVRNGRIAAILAADSAAPAGIAVHEGDGRLLLPFATCTSISTRINLVVRGLRLSNAATALPARSSVNARCCLNCCPRWTIAPARLSI